MKVQGNMFKINEIIIFVGPQQRYAVTWSVLVICVRNTVNLFPMQRLRKGRGICLPCHS